MSSIKPIIKAAAEAIKQQKWDEAAQQARSVLAKDAKNYQGHIFLAYALHSKGQLDEAEELYSQATALKPSDAQAWQGLVRIYEAQGGKKLARYQDAATHLALLFHNSSNDGDGDRTRETVERFLDFARAHGTRDQQARALEVILPEPSPELYAALAGRVAPPARTWEAVAQLVEAEERLRVNTLVDERRTRVGARLGDVTAEAKREVLAGSRLGEIYRRLIGWEDDDEVRRKYEEKLLVHCYERLVVFVPGAEKASELEVVLKLARDMVIIKHPFKLAWDITVDWQDHPDIGDWDFLVLRDYCSFFPESDLCRVLNGFLTSDISPFPKLEPPDDTEKPRRASESGATDDESEDDDDDGGGVATSYLPATEEDRLVMMTDGVSTADSLFAFRLMGEYYQHLEEHESNAELMRKALGHLAEKQAKTGLGFRHYDDAFTLYLGTALVYWQTPRHHQEAKGLFDAALAHDPSSTVALIGVGLIYEEEEEYDEARSFLERALSRDPNNLRVRAEAAWVTALKGDYASARQQLEPCIPLMEEAVAAANRGRDNDNNSSSGSSSSTGQQQRRSAKELLALAQYRLGVCVWELAPSRAARKERGAGSAYALFLAALRNDLNLAAAYTALGVFYADYARDARRARRCFHKAVELSAAEVGAAERLARSFADAADWERVELVARRVVDSGRVRPPPGSKRKGVGWPFAALGVAELNRLEHAQAVVSFQAALRVAPDDYHAWVGLGESYYASGRYIAATRALGNAVKLVETKDDVGGEEKAGSGAWFAHFMLANVKRELGEFDAAGEQYEQVLKSRPDEDGVVMALLQTRVENAQDSLEKDLFGKAVQLASDAIKFAGTAALHLREAFNFWKAIGDACAIFSSIQSRAAAVPRDALQALLGQDDTAPHYQYFRDIDGVGTGVVFASGLFADDEALGVDLTRCLHGAILAHKRAAHCAAHDVHAQAVSYYNLGWAELRAHSCLLREDGAGGGGSSNSNNISNSRYLTAAVRSFKRAIELEAGNAAFWNALGAATSGISPRVAQHCLARSLFLDERGGAQAWTNLGALALLQQDARLANEAFTRAQSSDPDYAHAWLGQAFVALFLSGGGGGVGGDAREARGLFTHAFGLADGASVAARRHYPVALFDQLVSGAAQPGGSGSGGGGSSSSLTRASMVQAIFALGQLQALRPQDVEYAHLATLFQERINDGTRAVDTLEKLCASLEAEYEAAEAPLALHRFVMARASLARSYLATHQYDRAVECGQMALELTSGDEEAGLESGRNSKNKSELTAEERAKVRLSTHLTVGLALYRNGDATEAVAYFETALEESDSNPDAVCLLAEVLWATGDEELRERARTLVFDVVERQPSHVESVILLGVISLLDDDAETMEAVTVELQGLRAGSGSAGAAESAQAQVGEVLLAMAALGDGATSGGEEAVLAQVQTNVMLYPHLPHGWSELAAVSGEAAPAEMALAVALKALPPRGSLGAEDIAKAYGGTGRAADAQTAIVLAPWAGEGWASLADAIESLS